MRIEVRSAVSLDAGKIGAILSEFTASTPWLPKIHSQAEDIAHAGIMIDRGWVSVAVTSQLIGFIAVHGDEINALYVSDAHRSKGVGKRLLDGAKAQSDVLRLWTFQANTKAQRFYEREGFHETQRTDGKMRDEQLPDIHYSWQGGHQ